MKISKIYVSALILTIFGSLNTRAGGLGDLLGGLGNLGGGDIGNTLGNLVEGVFSSSNITVSDMEGEWTATGPAVCFQGEGFLQKAGGVAAASAIETKLQPYYDKYGLNNATMSIKSDGTFTLNCKAIKLNGTITPATGAESGVFNFNFTIGNMKLASVTTYVQKTSSSMDVMFDATKLMNLLSAVAKYSGISTLQTVTSILDSYDGLCVGFNFKGGKQGNATGTGSNSSQGSELLQNGLDLLKGTLKK